LFLALPVWAKVLLILPLMALPPWLLIACGIGAAGVGIVVLLRGSLPGRLGSRLTSGST